MPTKSFSNVISVAKVSLKDTIWPSIKSIIMAKIPTNVKHVENVEQFLLWKNIFVSKTSEILVSQFKNGWRPNAVSTWINVFLYCVCKMCVWKCIVVFCLYFGISRVSIFCLVYFCQTNERSQTNKSATLLNITLFFSPLQKIDKWAWTASIAQTPGITEYNSVYFVFGYSPWHFE